jgi:tetratricopeptide (TPR) repeat protein
VGPIERAFYNSAGLQKFERMDGTYLQTAYAAPGVRIYAVEDIPPEFADPQPVVFEENIPAPATPEEPVLPEEPLPEGPPLEQLEAQWSADPGNAAIAYALAERYRDNDQVYEAIRVLELAAAANPDDVGLHHLWGDMLVLVRQHDEAEQVYRAIAEEVPTAGNWNKLGTSLMQWGELERAEEALQLAVAADPTEPEPYFRLGELYFRKGEREQAIAELEAYLERDPDGYLSGEAQALLNDLR